MILTPSSNHFTADGNVNLLVQWSAPTLQNGLIRDILVQWTSVDSATFLENGTVKATVSNTGFYQYSYKVTGLYGCTNYTVMVSACNKFGCGNKSFNSEVMPPPSGIPDMLYSTYAKRNRIIFFLKLVDTLISIITQLVDEYCHPFSQ